MFFEIKKDEIVKWREKRRKKEGKEKKENGKKKNERKARKGKKRKKRGEKEKRKKKGKREGEKEKGKKEKERENVNSTILTFGNEETPKYWYLKFRKDGIRTHGSTKNFSIAN